MMLSPRQGMIEPYTLEPGPHLFTDWRYVRPGMIRWDTADGQPTSLFATQGDPGRVQPHPLDVPHNLRIVARSPQKTSPFIGPDRPWEKVIFWSTLLYDGGKYRLWYEAVPGTYWDGKPAAAGLARDPGWGSLLCYAESDDLQTWTKPELGIFEYDGQASNIVLGGALTPETGYHGGSVFIDPSAPPQERYKSFYMGRLPLDRLRDCERRLGMTADTMALHYQSAMFAATSPDGLHWKPLPDPVMLANSDTSNRVYYDPDQEKYVAYVRMWLYGRRAVGRAETGDFARWPLPEPVLWITPGDNPAADIYTNAYTRYPGSSSQHLMFPALYRRDTDTTEIHIASSSEGRLWSFLPGGPLLTTGAEGAWDAGCLFAAANLMQIDAGRVALPVTGYHVPHKYPRSMPLGKMGFATWPAGRLAALEAPGTSSFTTPQLVFSGNHLCLNLETRRAGEVLVEVAEAEGSPKPVPQAEGQAVPGLSFADCDPICGDLPAHTVTWRGNADLSALAGKPVSLRFRLRAASLYAFHFE
ncbi:MAG: hypothetical protein HY872_09515 [Chloroflexi bacterium]|nr:hypothetical protein [Chloroflexota bacterium]